MIVSSPYRSAMWCGCQGVGAECSLGDGRARELDDHEHAGDGEHHTDRRVGNGQSDPSDLREGQRGDIRRPRNFGVARRGVQPESTVR